MKQLTIYARQENRLKELAKKHKCKVTINNRFNVYPSDISYASEYANGAAYDTGYQLQKSFNKEMQIMVNQVLFEAITVTIEAEQDGNQVKLLGVVNEEGYVETLSSDINWGDFDVENIDMFRCDKCNTKHKRKKVYIVEGIAGDYVGQIMQVGGHCAVQLDCEKALKKLLKKVQFFIDDLEKYEDDFLFNWGKGTVDYPIVDSLEELFQVSAGFILKHGYVSNAEAENNRYYNSLTETESTGKRIKSLFIWDGSQCATEAELTRKRLINFLPEDERVDGFWTEKVLNWLNNQDNDSDYIHNAKIAIAKRDFRKIGILVSLVWMVIKQERKDKEKAIREAFTEEVIKPIEGAKISIEALVISAKVYDDYYGSRKGLTVLDKKYGKIFFKTQSEWVWDVKANDIIKGKITIKTVKDDISFAKTSSRKFEINETSI